MVPTCFLGLYMFRASLEILQTQVKLRVKCNSVNNNPFIFFLKTNKQNVLPFIYLIFKLYLLIYNK